MRRGVILRIHERVSLSPNLPRYGSCNQILGVLFVSVIVSSLSLSLSLDTGGDGLNWLISLGLICEGNHSKT